MNGIRIDLLHACARPGRETLDLSSPPTPSGGTARGSEGRTADGSGRSLIIVSGHDTSHRSSLKMPARPTRSRVLERGNQQVACLDHRVEHGGGSLDRLEPAGAIAGLRERIQSEYPMPRSGWTLRRRSSRFLGASVSRPLRVDASRDGVGEEGVEHAGLCYSYSFDKCTESLRSAVTFSKCGGNPVLFVRRWKRELVGGDVREVDVRIDRALGFLD